MYVCAGVGTRWLQDEGTVTCYDGDVRCPPHVTPLFLEEGKNQGVCFEERDTYYCEVKCTPGGDVMWDGVQCPDDLTSPCPPWKRTLVPEFAATTTGSGAGARLHGPNPLLPAPATVDGTPGLRGVDKLAGEYLVSVASASDKKYIDMAHGFDLRGLQVGARLHGCHFGVVSCHQCNCECCSVRRQKRDGALFLRRSRGP